MYIFNTLTEIKNSMISHNWINHGNGAGIYRYEVADLMHDIKKGNPSYFNVINTQFINNSLGLDQQTGLFVCLFV